ncbi:MAG: hypothetical protein JST64_04035 [Actinobacteria bacterium]|nr:hypothetical protein [Actinomycetota bacterium]
MIGTSPRRAGGTAQLLTHLGMALAALAFASWWTTHTVYDTTRTRRIAAIVLASPDLRSYVAEKIAPVVVQALPPGSPAATPAAPLSSDQLATGISNALGRAEVQQGLVEFVGQLHDRLIGVGTGPVVLDQHIVQELAGAADPNLTSADLAKIPSASIPIPQQAGLAAGTSTMRSRWPWYALGAVGLLVAALVVTGDKRATLQLIGRWLIGISVVQLLVLYVVPVWIVPRVTSNPWADLVASVVREWGAPMVTGLALLAAAGVVFVVADHLVPSHDGEHAPPAPPAPA